MIGDTELANGTALEDDRTLVGAFGTLETARAAAQALHDEGFHKTWIGITRIEDVGSEADAETTVRADDDSAGAKIGRFFSGEANGASLMDALTHRGVSAFDARHVDASIEPADVVLTVHGSNHPDLAAQIIEDFEGDVLVGGYDDGAARLAAANDIDPAARSLLREAREQPATVPVMSEDFFETSPLGFDDEEDDAHHGATGTQRNPNTEF